MANLPLKKQLIHFFPFLQRQRTSGFTLIELLVVIIIAGGIISGLMYLVVELLGVDQRESSRTETQREMQLAMDYIAEDLREAVYIYNGACFVGGQDNDPDAPNYCPRSTDLIDYLPENLSEVNGNVQNIPVLAFWKQQPLPRDLKAYCNNNLTAAESALIPCTSASSYALIVYYISTDPEGNVWRGNARIKRYALTEFRSSGIDRTPGYVLPDLQQVKFDAWPLAETVNRQASRPDDTSVVLVDFLDRQEGVPSSPTTVATCPTGYEISPSSNVFSDLGSDSIRSFYACIDDSTAIGRNRDVILYLRGNAQGRPGITNPATFTPTLETRVLVRGVLGKTPED
jgi:prepilin-type N-terminal cleavage/methylation domain-containing protein